MSHFSAGIKTLAYLSCIHGLWKNKNKKEIEIKVKQKRPFSVLASDCIICIGRNLTEWKIISDIKKMKSKNTNSLKKTTKKKKKQKQKKKTTTLQLQIQFQFKD